MFFEYKRANGPDGSRDLDWKRPLLLRFSKPDAHLECKEVLNHLASLRMSLVEEFGMELDTVNPSSLLLHCLDGAGLVRRGLTKSIRQLLDLVAVRMPNRYPGWQVFEQAVASVINREEAALPLRPRVTFARIESLHQPDLGAIGQRNLLMAPANSENWLTGLFYDAKDPRQ